MSFFRLNREILILILGWIVSHNIVSTDTKGMVDDQLRRIRSTELLMGGSGAYGHFSVVTDVQIAAFLVSPYTHKPLRTILRTNPSLGTRHPRHCVDDGRTTFSKGELIITESEIIPS
jgi:hypothetical protein